MEPLTQLAINTLRFLSVDAVQKANSGHPGLPLGAAPMLYVLWHRHLRHNPKHPSWPNRDRFVLSAGHGSAALYSLLHLTGYDLAMEDLKAFRQWGSRTPGHPENYSTPGVEASTGPLGQGAANSVGMAIAEAFLAARYNRPGHTVVDHMTYALLGDGDMMEGITHEAASLAGHLKLGKLVWLYDDNKVSLDGPTSLHFTEDVAARFESCGWHVQKVADGDHDVDGIDRALAAAKADPRPSLVMVHTTIGYGSPNKSNSADSHGAPLGVDEVKLTKSALGWDPSKQFFVPDEVRAHLGSAVERGAQSEAAWQKAFESWAVANPGLAGDWKLALRGALPPDWDATIPSFADGEDQATRTASSKILAAIAGTVPWFIGGDADLSCSTMTALPGHGDFSAENRAGRNIHFGVREHAMGAIANGLAYHGQARPYTATFFVFSDYERPALRMAALSRLPVLFLFSHDSIGVGEDGPAHQPVEHLACLRAIPNLWVIRPADAAETAQAYRAALKRTDGPVAIVLTRQKVPSLDRTRFAPATGLAKGAYVLSESSGRIQLLLIATGSEVSLALAAQEKLAAQGIGTRVVSMPSWELFAEQSQDYRDSVLPPEVTARISIEAGISLGWHRFVGDRGLTLSLDRFGASGPGSVLIKQFGFTADHIVRAANTLLRPT
jgi:transketolase